MKPPANCNRKPFRAHSLRCACPECRAGIQPKIDGYASACTCDFCGLQRFDRDPSFGPKIGITRHGRLKRAIRLDLRPDEDQRLLVLKYDDVEYEF